MQRMKFALELPSGRQSSIGQQCWKAVSSARKRPGCVQGRSRGLSCMCAHCGGQRAQLSTKGSTPEQASHDRQTSDLSDRMGLQCLACRHSASMNMVAPHVLRPRERTIWYLFELQAVAPRDEQRSTLGPNCARHCFKYCLKAAHHLAPLRRWNQRCAEVGLADHRAGGGGGGGGGGAPPPATAGGGRRELGHEGGGGGGAGGT